MPQEARLLSSTPLPLPEYSVSVEIGRGVPGQNTGGIQSSHNKIVFSGLFTLGAGGRTEIDLVYDLPASVARREGDGITYDLVVQKQPGVRQRKVSVDLILPEGYHVIKSSVPAAQNDDSRASFSFLLTRDTRLSVELARNVDGSQ